MRLPPVSLLAGLISSSWNQPQKLRVLAISRRRHMGRPIPGMPLSEVNLIATNPRQGTRTVESVLEEALFKAGAISKDNYGDLNKIGWSRASRTDKGVHAAKCVVVAKLLVNPHDFNSEGFNVAAKDEFNAVLPSDLHVFRVPKSFRGRPECSYREYEYYFPRSVFDTGDEYTNYELRLQNILARYLGTNSFHNFSSIDERSIEKKKVKDKMRTDRRGNTIHREEPGPRNHSRDKVKVLEGKEENVVNLELGSTDDSTTTLGGKHQRKEWGQGEVLQKALRSEMRTTIRLMVGAAVAEALELVPDGTVEAALKTPYQISFALAPGEGLLLSGQGFTGGSAYGNAAVLDPTELSQLEGTFVDYDEGSGNSMSSKGRVQALCKPGDILASDEFKSNTILPEISRAWDAENGNLAHDWITWAQRKSAFEEFHLALVAAKEKMAVADHSNDLIKCNAYREMAFANEESVKMNEYFPRGFSTSIIVTFNLIPGSKAQSIQLALLNRMKSGALPQLSTTEDLLDCVAREGVDSMAKEGGFVGCLERKEAA